MGGMPGCREHLSDWSDQSDRSDTAEDMVWGEMKDESLSSRVKSPVSAPLATAEPPSGAGSVRSVQSGRSEKRVISLFPSPRNGA